MTGFKSIEELVAVVELEDLLVWEDSARRRMPTPEAEAGQTSGDEDFGFKLAVRLEDFTAGFRFQLKLEVEHVKYVTDIEAVYKVPKEGPSIAQTDRAIVSDFAERVAFMSVYPYSRTAVHGASGRLGVSRPMLPVVRPGQVSGSQEELSPEELKEAFGFQASGDRGAR